MKRLACLILALAMLLALAACGAASDPNTGTYVATTCEYNGIQYDAEEFLEMAWTVELKNGGRAVLVVDGEPSNARWTLDGENITLTDASGSLSGTLRNGTMILDVEDVLVTLKR